MAVANNSLINEPILEQAFNYAVQNNKPIHFMGLLSDGGVHSHINHLKGLLTAANEFGVKENMFMPLQMAGMLIRIPEKGFVAELEEHLIKTDGKLASVIGRYFAMDRDKRWERVKKAYDLIVSEKARKHAMPWKLFRRVMTIR